MSAYNKIEERFIKDINSNSIIYTHKKTRAKIAILKNEDKNKVFYVGFRTPVNNDKGTPHILEHSVLCGSKAFPLKDPFVELVKGSLNTFLNAMTYNEKTLYPVASCNDKDFKNLMHVYMDAVFYPNIYDNKKIFLQEGISYKLENENDDLEYNGVVYNEMKGVFSNPDVLLDSKIHKELFPDTTYGFESGGDPKSIPSLSYEEFLDFHRKYYHPSNSYIYLYGDIDVEERLSWLDENYLSKFDYLEVDSSIMMQKPSGIIKEFEIDYSISEDEDEKDKTYYSITKVVSDALDNKLYYAFQILDYVLISMPGAIIKKALLDNNIGDDIYGGYDYGILQPTFSVYAKNATKEKKEQFLEVVNETLLQVVREGINKNALKAGLSVAKFRYREADYGTSPKGLIYGLNAMNSWLYDDKRPFLHLEANDTFEYLESKIESGYFEELIKEYLIDNNHGVIVSANPKKGLTNIEEKEIEKELLDYKNSLTSKEIKNIVTTTKELLKYQSEPTKPEDLLTIPLLERTDISKDSEPFINEEIIVDETKVVFHEVFTNKIGYVDIVFDTREVPDELIHYIAILRTVFAYMDTKKKNYIDLSNEIDINCGGFSNTLNIYNKSDSDEYILGFEISSKLLYENFNYLSEILDEIINETIYNDEKRLKEIISEVKSKLQNYIVSSGHRAAALRSTTYFSETGMIKDMLESISFFGFIKDILKDFDNKKEEIIANICKVSELIFNKKNMVISFTADKEGLDLFMPVIKNINKSIKDREVVVAKRSLSLKKLNEGIKNSSQIQYVAQSGNFAKAGYEFVGYLRILKVILEYEYLWNNIRVKNGAYGVMADFTRKGDAYFVSYRDPNLLKTYEVFKNIPQFLEEFDPSDREMTKYVIGTISDIDIPLTPRIKGKRSFSAYMTNTSYETINKERTEILAVTKEDIKKLKGLIKEVLEQNNICTIGNEANINKASDIFENVYNIFE